MLTTLLVTFLMVPAVVLVVGTAVFRDDRRTQEALLAAAGLWYSGLFCIAGIIYVFNTLTTISTYGK